MKTHYDVLGVSSNADEATIRMAFRKAAKIYHPDLNAGDPVAEERFKQITAAHAVLANPERRAAFDRMRRCQAWRAWRITLVSWIVAALLSAGLTAGCVFFVRSMAPIKDGPTRSSGASLIAEPTVGATEGTYDAQDRQTVAVVRDMRLHEPLVPVRPSSEDRQPPRLMDPEDDCGVDELARTRDDEPALREDAGADVNARVPSLREPTTRVLRPTTMNQTTGSNAVGRKRAGPPPFVDRSPIETVQSVGSMTRGTAKRTVHTASLGDYIFYEHTSTGCEIGDEVRFGDPSFSECVGARTHHLSKHHGVKERRAAARRVLAPN